MRRTGLWPIVIAGALALGLGRAPMTAAVGAPAGVPVGVQASAPLGSVTTIQVSVDNSGQPAATAQLYEALASTALSVPAPLTGPLRVPLPPSPGPVTPDLLANFARSPDGRSDMIVYLADQADLSAASALPDWNARGAAVVAALQQAAADSQGPLLASLRKAGYAPRPFWIVNAIEVKGDRALAESLASQTDVALVAANVQHNLSAEPSRASAAGGGVIAWGIQQIGVPSVWADWGVRGAGVTVANLDTGVAYTHTGLLHQYRGWSPSGISNDYNWYDISGDPPSPRPVDSAGHGTHTMGTMVGGAAGGYGAVGVAPAARWMAVRGCAGLFCLDADLITGAQWLLAPTDLAGHNPRPDLRPQVINNSWGQTGDDPWYAGYVTAWNAAGIFSAFAIGNNGFFAGCQTTITPGNYANSFGVGATDTSDQAATFSSRGPTTDGRTKPDISAPGVDIPSTWLDGGAELLSGTSMAAPHVAGVVALLWSANPALIGNLPATEHVLTSTAVPRPTTECGTPTTTVPNNVYGWGRLDARAAVQQTRVDVPWMSLPPSLDLPANGLGQFPLTLDARQVVAPGTYTARVLVTRDGESTSIPVTFTVQSAANTATLRGRLTDLWQGGNVYGRVQIGAGPAVVGDANGLYTVTLPYGSYVLTATANGYFSATSTLALNAPAVSNFILQPDLPHIRWATGLISATLSYAQQVRVPITVTNAGSEPLTLTATVPPLDWLVDQAGVPGGTLYDLSAVQPVSLTDDAIYSMPLQLGFEIPIYGTLFDHIYLSSNGWVSAVLPPAAQPLASCFPSYSLPPFSLAPFWADLDPGVGGAVRFARVNPTTFVVSFEHVPPWRQTPDPSGPTFTFQLVLHADGRIEFLYGDMGPLPDRWSVGASFDSTRGQSFACYRANAVSSNTVWRVRNQPASDQWLGSSGGDVTIKPGASVTLQAVLSGFGFAPWYPNPLVGTLRLLSNDPIRPYVDLPAQVVVAPAPYQSRLPVIQR